MTLDDLQIQRLKPKAKRYKKGMGKSLNIVVYPNGTKCWHFRYRVDKKENQISFGSYPEVSIEEALTRTMAAREQLRNGVIPSEDRKLSKSKMVYNNKVINTSKASKDLLARLIRLQTQVIEATELIKTNPSQENLVKIIEFIDKI